MIKVRQIAMKWVRTLFSALASHVNRSVSEAHRWFRAGKTFWIWLALTITILLVFYTVIPGELPDRVRLAGVLFELLGITAVVIGINRARRSFGKPTVLQGIWIWLGEFRFIFFRRPPITGTMNITLGSDSAVAVGTVVNRAPRPIEERIAELEKQTLELQGNVGTLDRKVDQQKRALMEELNKEVAARRVGDESVGKKLEEGMVGDSALELAGVSYLYLGVAMAHLSAEVAMGLEWLGFS
jgi:hypothetical protein